MTLYVYPDGEWRQCLELVDTTSPYALTGAVFATERRALAEAERALRDAAGNFYINDKPTGAVVGQQPFGGARASGTNDKAGSMLNLLRWVSARTIKETLVPPTSYGYPFMLGEYHQSTPPVDVVSGLSRTSLRRAGLLRPAWRVVYAAPCARAGRGSPRRGHFMTCKAAALIAVLLATTLVPESAMAQTGATAQIGGTVRDESGGVLPGVTVTATQTDTGVSRETQTDADGAYLLTNMPIGPYRLEAGLAGFRSFVQTGIVLQVERQSRHQRRSGARRRFRTGDRAGQRGDGRDAERRVWGRSWRTSAFSNCR